jgi:hypothetical protein
MHQENVFVYPKEGQPFRRIQPWHIVVGDTQAGKKTTPATQIVREEKERFKSLHHGKGLKFWGPLAQAAWEERLRQEFPEADENERGQILIKCSSKAADRVLVANVFGYEDDGVPTYGLANSELAIDFFLDSRDAPKLREVIDKYMKEIEEHFGIDKPSISKLKGEKKSPSAAMAHGFFKTLLYYHETLEDASKGDEFAEELLKEVKPINKLKRLWEKVSKSKDTSNEARVQPGFRHLLQRRLGLFNKMQNISQTGQQWQIPAEKFVDFDETLKLFEIKLRSHEHDDTFPTEPAVICPPGSSLDELKLELDEKWKQLKQPSQDNRTCNTEEETISEDGMVGFEAQPFVPFEQGSSVGAGRQRDTTTTTTVTWAFDGFCNNFPTKNLNTMETSDEGSLLMRDALMVSPKMSPCSRGYRDGFSDSFASMTQSQVELLQNTFPSDPSIENGSQRQRLSNHSYDLFSRMSLSAHSNFSFADVSVSLGSKKIMDTFPTDEEDAFRMEFFEEEANSSSPSEQIAIYQNEVKTDSMLKTAPRSSPMMQRVLRSKYGLSKTQSRQVVHEAMIQLGLTNEVLYTRALEATCLDLAEEKGWFVNGTAPPTTFPTHVGWAHIPTAENACESKSILPTY